MTDIELCYKCATEGSTPYNVHSIIITALNKQIATCKLGIYHLSNDVLWVKDCRETIVTNMKAIRAFYKRFPHLERTYNYYIQHYAPGPNKYSSGDYRTIHSIKDKIR